MDRKLDLKRWIAVAKKMNQYLLRLALMVGIKKEKELTSCYNSKNISSNFRLIHMAAL
jgi:hypothetical protein